LETFIIGANLVLLLALGDSVLEDVAGDDSVVLVGLLLDSVAAAAVLLVEAAAGLGSVLVRIGIIDEHVGCYVLARTSFG